MSTRLLAAQGVASLLAAQGIASPLAAQAPQGIASRARPAARRGFTAVELISAITASLVVSAAAYTLARTSLSVFQQEARMNSAQFSNIMGMNRIATDAKRAGYQSSPDPGTDAVSLCDTPPAPLDQLLTAVRVTDSTSGGNVPGGVLPAYPVFPPEVMAGENVRMPDRVRFAGNYSTSERFKLANVVAGVMAIECDQLSVQRVFNGAQAGGPGICALFPLGGVIRVVDPTGKGQFATVAACVAVPNGTTSYQSVQLTVNGLNAGTCTTDVSQGYVNPVNIIDYFLTNLEASAASNTALGLPPTITTPLSGGPGYGVEDPGLAGVTGEPSRMTLIRRQLSGTGAPIPLTGEIVADYVADLKFSARVATPAVVGLTRVELVDNLNDTSVATGFPPNRLRSLGIRLTTRARNPDRVEGPIPADANAPLTLFHVFPPLAVARNRYARVRTMNMEVSLPNLGAFLPW